MLCSPTFILERYVLCYLSHFPGGPINAVHSNKVQIMNVEVTQFQRQIEIHAARQRERIS